MLTDIYTCILSTKIPHAGVHVFCKHLIEVTLTKIESEYDQEIPQLQTADNPKAPRGRAT